MSLFADELGSVEDEITAGTEHAYNVANWRPFHNLKHGGIEILRYFPENTRHVLSIVCLYRRCQQKSRPGTHSSSRQLNPFFFSLLSLPGGLFSTGVSFCLQRVDSSSQWEYLPASKPPNVQKPPPTGTIIPLTSIQSPDSSSQWENPPAGSPPNVQKPPLTGTITPLASRPTSQSFQ